MNNTTVAKNTTIELSVKTTYRRSWGAWEAIRELIQNGLDSQDDGNALTIERGAGEKTSLYIRNEGTTLPRETLLLGETTKAAGRSRGKFGEGYKIALLTLARMGIPVQIRTADEMWTPVIEASGQLNAEVLKVKIRQQPKYVNYIEVQIHYVSDEVWKGVCGRLLDIPSVPSSMVPAEKKVELPHGKILLDPSMAGKLYTRGLYVGVLQGTHAYGYDLSDVELDHDRKMANPYSLSRLICALLREAIENSKLSGEALLKLFQADCTEAQYLKSNYAYGGNDVLTAALVKAFDALYGDAMAVSSMGESLEAAHYGVKTVVVSDSLKTLVEREKGSLDAKLTSRGGESKRTYAVTDLTAAELEVMEKAVVLVSSVRPAFDFKCLAIVDFYNDKILGSYTAGFVRLAKSQLKTLSSAINVLVHEVAHAKGSDGSHEHMHEMQAIFSDIISQMAY